MMDNNLTQYDYGQQKRTNQNEINQKIAMVDHFVKRTYLSTLTDFDVVPLTKDQKKFNTMGLYCIDKLVYDKSEDINDKLVSVFNSVQNLYANLIFILRGTERGVEFYIGAQSNQSVGLANDILFKSMQGNFPGSVITKVSHDDCSSLMEKITSFNTTEQGENLACLNVIPANRNPKEFIQGLEKYIDTMRGEKYVCILLASSVTDSECELRLQGYEQLYSTLFPLSNMSLAQGTSIGHTITRGYSNSVSHSISEGITKTTGHNSARTVNRGFNAGVLGFGTNQSWGVSEGNFVSDALQKMVGETITKVDNVSNSENNAVTHNVTVNYKDKMVEDILEHIDHRIQRIKECMTYGMWECAAYFMSDNAQTTLVAANAFRSLMVGENNKNEKNYLKLFYGRDQRIRASTLTAIESLKYGYHPLFRIPTNEGPLIEYQEVTATEYLSGKELPVMFALPRKPVAGIAVTSTAEFGRDVIYIDGNVNGEREYLNVGKITHMNQIENTDVNLDLQSLTSHCFVTGATGSGKSNTVFTMLNGLMESPNPIPFLVIEPAKGEYKYAFAGVPGINIFTTTLTIGRFFKINPFKFPENIHVLEHLDRLIEIFNTCWEMYAAMPAILKDAMERCYERKGWNLINSVYLNDGEPQYPTFKDLLAELPNVINQSDYSSETKGDYVGALVTRVNSLTNGIVGQIFCDCYDIDDRVLFDESTIIDLSHVGASETKSLIMGILVLKLTEYRMAFGNADNSALRHVTVLEEAHNLLKNVKNTSGIGGSQVVAKSVEIICNSIAEMRTYGESFILVDQSPSAVDIAAIKNTNTKVIMRLLEAGDCEAVGRSVSLNENQIGELSKLRTGVAVVMQNNWCDAVLARINHYDNHYKSDVPACCGKKLLEFKSVVVSAILEEYSAMEFCSKERIFEKIEKFEIDSHKKNDAVCMVNYICDAMDSKWNSVVFGNTLLRYVGIEDMFRRAEQTFPDISQKGDDLSENVQNAANLFLEFLNNEISKILNLTGVHQWLLLYYFIFAKKADTDAFDYDLIFQINMEKGEIYRK